MLIHTNLDLEIKVSIFKMGLDARKPVFGGLRTTQAGADKLSSNQT